MHVTGWVSTLPWNHRWMTAVLLHRGKLRINNAVNQLNDVEGRLVAKHRIQEKKMMRLSDGVDGNGTEGRKMKTQAKLQGKEKTPWNEHKTSKPKSARQRSTVNQIRYF